MELMARHIDKILESLVGIAYQLFLDRDELRWFGNYNSIVCRTLDTLPKNTEEWLKSCHVDDLEYVQKEFDRLLKEKSSFDLCYRLKVNGSGYRWFIDKGFYVEDEKEGRVILGIMTDVTDQMKFKEKLHELGARLDFQSRITDKYWRNTNDVVGVVE
jgi:PAS domain-containing protein